MTPGQAANVSQAEELLEGLSAKVVIADKAYDNKALVDSIECGVGGGDPIAVEPQEATGV